MNLKGRNFLTLKDFTPEEILYLLDLSAELKAKKKAGELTEYYKGKNIALIFEKTSTRTRCSPVGTAPYCRRGRSKRLFLLDDTCMGRKTYKSEYCLWYGPELGRTGKHYGQILARRRRGAALAGSGILCGFRL